MSKKLFVGNLAFGISEDELQTIFAEHGKIMNTRLITDKYSGQSRGFGFVEMENDGEAEEAIKKLNNKELKGRNIVVNVARPMGDRNNRKSNKHHSSHGSRNKWKW